MEKTELELVDMKNGKLIFQKFEIIKRNTFLEYIFGGCEINLSIAIDFTVSNLKPSDPQSWHSLDMNNNHYYQAL